MGRIEGEEMKIVTIPFMDNFKDAMLDGRKIMTCRSKAYGKFEDVFCIFGASFMLTAVYKVKLGYVAWNCFAKEGCKDGDEFIEIWNKLHPRKGYNSEAIVFAHEFVRVE